MNLTDGDLSGETSEEILAGHDLAVLRAIVKGMEIVEFPLCMEYRGKNYVWFDQENYVTALNKAEAKQIASKHSGTLS